MKKTALIILGLIVLWIISVLSVMHIKSMMYEYKNSPQSSNKNITFIGKNKGFYQYGKSIRRFDGSVIIASTVNDVFKKKNYISLIRLSPQGLFDWEKKISLPGKSLGDFVQNPLKHEINPPLLQILGFNFMNDRFFMLVNRMNKQDNQLYILTFDVKHKLIKTQKVKLVLKDCTQLTAFLQNNYAHTCYLDLKNKMLCQAKIDLETGKILHNAMLFYKQKGLQINAITADWVDSTASITAYDSKIGCSYYMYSKKEDLKEYFRTEPTSNFTMLKYLGDKLYGIVKEDSLMELVDMTSLSKPLIINKFTPDYDDFRAVDMRIMNENVYIVMDVKQHMKEDWDVAVLKFTSPFAKPQVYLIEGKEMEFSKEIVQMADGNFIIMGQSFSYGKGKMLKLFATKFAL